MNKTSLASLEQRLSDWTSLEMSVYHLGACLGFWPEFGAPVSHGGDPWYGMKDLIFKEDSSIQPLICFLGNLSIANILEMKETSIPNESKIPDIKIEYRWNKNFSYLSY